MPAWFWEGVLVLLAANEIGGWTEWLARRLVRWSAHIRYANSPYRSDMAEELERVVIDRPGQVLKLFTAGCFALAAIRAWLARLPVQPAVGSLRLAAAAYAGTVTLTWTITATAALALYSALTLPAAVPVGGTSAGPPQGTIDPVVRPQTGTAVFTNFLDLTGTVRNVAAGDKLVMFLQPGSIPRYFPGGNPVGQPSHGGVWSTIVDTPSPYSPTIPDTPTITLWLVSLGPASQRTLAGNPFAWHGIARLRPARDATVLAGVEVYAPPQDH